jgi:cytochrome c oxidase subunit 1
MTHSRIAGGDFTGAAPLDSSLRTFITVATILTVAAQAIFVVNLVGTLWRGRKSEERNPWQTTTLEWTVASPPPSGNFGASEPVVYRGAYEFDTSAVSEDFTAQNLAPNAPEAGRQARRIAKFIAKET